MFKACRPFVFKIITTVLFFGTILMVNNAQTENKPLTNNDIIRMVNAKIKKSIILEKIKTSDNTFDVSTDGLIQLDKAKVKTEIIEAMMKAARTTQRSSSSNRISASGLIFKDDEKSIAEIINEPTIQTKISKFLVFNLKRCNRSDSVIACYFAVSNRGEDKKLSLNTEDTSLVDNQGNEKLASEFNMGANRGENITHLLPQGNPVLLWIRFERQSLNITKILRVNVKFGVIHRGSTIPNFEEVQFQDIPILKGIVPRALPWSP